MSQPASARIDLSRSSVARYIQLSTLFRSRITSGIWPVGDQIPTVDELSTQCGVARATIRQAIGLLETDGLVSRFRAKGTFVNAPAHNASALREVATDWQGLLSAHEDAQIEVLSDTIGAAPPHPPHRLGTLSNTYRRLRRRHLVDGRAYLVADVYLDERLSRKIPDAAFTSRTALRLVSGIPGVRIVSARQTLTVGAADIETAELLNVALNAPICRVDRSAADQRGRMVLIAFGHYRGDVVRFDMKIR